MNSLSDELSNLDDLEIYCLQHEIPCIGICSKFNCNQKPRFFCMKCIKSGNTCITQQKHELISLSEILFRFYKNQDTLNQPLIKKIRKVGKAINQSKAEDYDNFGNKYKNIKEQIIPIQKAYTELIDKFILSFKQQNAKEMHNLKTLSKTDEILEKDISKILLNIRMPPIDKKSLSNNKKLKKIIEEGNRLSTPDNFVHSLKLLNNKYKSNQMVNKLNNKIFANKVCSNISNIDNNKAKLEKKIDNILKEFEDKIDKSLDNFKNSLLAKNKTTNTPHVVTPYVQYASNPKNLYFRKNLTLSAQRTYLIDKVFCAFTSFQKQTLLVWGNITNLEFFDIDNNKLIKEIASAHLSQIFCCRHYPDNKAKVDYILTTSHDCSIKVWNVNLFTNEAFIRNPYVTKKNIFSACLLIDHHLQQKYIISSSVSDFMKLYEFNGRYRYSFGISDGNTFFINSYYDSKNKRYYIINGNSLDIRSYDLKDGSLFNRYQGTPRCFHTAAIIYDTKIETTLIEIDGNGYIRFWNFHTANLIKSIYINSFVNLRGLCLWNHKFLIVGGNEHQIKIVDLKQGKVVKYFKEHTGTICTIERINSKVYGECLLSQGMDGAIKLWSIQ